MQTLRERCLSEPGETRETLQRLFEFLTRSGYNLDYPAHCVFGALTNERIEKFSLNLREKSLLRIILAEINDREICTGYPGFVGDDASSRDQAPSAGQPKDSKWWCAWLSPWGEVQDDGADTQQRQQQQQQVKAQATSCSADTTAPAAEVNNATTSMTDLTSTSLRAVQQPTCRRRLTRVPPSQPPT